MHSDQFAQSDNVGDTPKRRATDFVPSDFPNNSPTNADLLREIRLTRQDVLHLQNSVGLMKDAFVLNDLGKPDYEGHRSAHRTMIDAQKTLQGYKVDLTKKALAWSAGIIAAVFVTGAHEHIKRLFSGFNG